MKLLELNPRWVGLDNASFIFGISFDCPTKREQRLVVFFDPPIDPFGWTEKGIVLPTFEGHKVWKREGDTFESLSLTPSIDASRYELWHGFITKGEIK